jgi:hypothetical protein
MPGVLALRVRRSLWTARAMTEANLQAAVTELAGSLGLDVLHVRDVRREHRAWKGFPDVVIVGQAGIAFRELKQAGAGLRGEQKRWAWRLCEAGQDVAEWRPADWHSGRIAAELAALAGQDGTPDVSDDPDPERAFFRALYGKPGG